MASFKDAFREGQKAANRLRDQQRAIQQVLTQLKDELYIETQGRVLIKVRRLISRDTLNWKTMDDMVTLRNVQVHYHAICAENPQVPDSLLELGRWEQDDTGFPCRIFCGKRLFHCADEQSLVQALHEMLKMQEVNRKIAKLLEQEAPTDIPHNTDAHEERMNRAIRRTQRPRSA